MSAGFLGDSGEGALPALALGWFVALLFLWLWWSRTRFARLLKDVPSTPIRGVFVGLVETSGKVEHDDPMIATKSPCRKSPQGTRARAASKNAGLISMPVMRAAGSRTAKASASAPVPQPASSTDKLRGKASASSMASASLRDHLPMLRS